MAIAGVAVAGWVSGLSLASPADPGLSPCQAQITRIESKVGGHVNAVSGAFAVAAAKVADWQERRMAPGGPRVVSQWRQAPAAEILNVCYFDGLFLAPGGPAGGARPPYDRLVVIVDAKGNLTLDTATWQRVFPVVDPSKS